VSGERRRPRFRAIAIVGSAADAQAIAGALAPYVPLAALMLRDAGHSAPAVATMHRAIADDLPDDLDVIANVVAGLTRWVHLPFADRERVRDPLVASSGVGVSVHSLDEARAVADHVDYLIASPVHPTPSKPGHCGMGLAGLRAICAGVDVPVFALGGITVDGIAQCFDAGAYGIAGIGLFGDIRTARSALETVTRYA
jgi:hypothetical protein